MPVSESRAHPHVAPQVAVGAPRPLGLVRATWEHWKQIAHAIGVVQTRVIMVFVYFLFVMPTGLVMRLRGDPLHLKPHPDGNWTPHRYEEPSIDSAHRQF